MLLDALARHGTLRRFAPFDVSEPTLRAAAHAVAGEYGAIEVHAVVGDFEHHLARPPTGGTRVVAFLGGTIGNLAPHRGTPFSPRRARTAPGDAFLLGTDLVKDSTGSRPRTTTRPASPRRSTRTCSTCSNRELGADFEPDRFEHVARWVPEHEWIEMRLRTHEPQTVKVAELDLIVDFAPGEEMRTEISAKFRREGVARELAAVGLELAEWWTDAAGDFALSLAVPATRPS